MPQNSPKFAYDRVTGSVNAELNRPCASSAISNQTKAVRCVECLPVVVHYDVGACVTGRK